MGENFTLKNRYKNYLNSIIQIEKKLIGELAITLAKKVRVLDMDADGNVIDYRGSGEKVLSDLINQYKRMIGEVAPMIIGKNLRLLKEGNKLKDGVELPENLKKWCEKDIF